MDKISWVDNEETNEEVLQKMHESRSVLNTMQQSKLSQ